MYKYHMKYKYINSDLLDLLDLLDLFLTMGTAGLQVWQPLIHWCHSYFRKSDCELVATPRISIPSNDQISGCGKKPGQI